MFGPNVVPNFTHRDAEFKSVYRDFKTVIRSLFSLTNDDEVIYVTGSGTLANEIVLSSLIEPANVITDGGFSDRIRSTLEHHNKLDAFSNTTVAVQFETGQSKYSHSSRDAFIVDGVSALPYYNLFGSAVTTVLSKQFGLRTGTSIIIIRDAAETLKKFRSPEPTYLSLMKYVEYANDFQTPNTPNIDGMVEAIVNLRYFDTKRFRERIDSRIVTLMSAANAAGISVRTGPVCTFLSKGPLVESLVKEFSLYTRSGNPQLFLWTGTDSDFNRLIGKIYSHV